MADDVTLRMLLVGEDKSASKALKNVGKAANGAAKESTLAGSALKGIAAGVSISAAVKVLGDLRDAGEESVASNARLEQVFKSMGDTTGRAAEQAENYADKLAMQIGVDDDIIKSTEAKLATFKAVSNETAMQAGIFERATDAAADLAATGFGTMETNAAQLGKALQDPVKGLTALRKAGVTFTDQERDQIAALVKSGKTLEAQKVILAAIESQVGGVAKATAKGSDIQAVAIGQMQQKLGEELLPAFDNVTQAAINFTDAVGENDSALRPFIDTVIGLSAGLNDISSQLSDSTSALSWFANAMNNVSGVAAVQWLMNQHAAESFKEVTHATRGSTGALGANKKAWDGQINSVEDSIRALKEASKSLDALKKKAKALDGTKIRFSVLGQGRRQDEVHRPRPRRPNLSRSALRGR